MLRGIASKISASADIIKIFEVAQRIVATLLVLPGMMLDHCSESMVGKKVFYYGLPPLPPTSFVEAYLDLVATHSSAGAFDPWSNHRAFFFFSV